MANMKNFLKDDIRSGSKSTLYLYPAVQTPIGDVQWQTVEDLRITGVGKIKLFGEHSGPFELIMGSYQPNGNDCTLVLDGRRFENVNYRTVGHKLELKHEDLPVAVIEIYPGARAWTWFDFFKGIKFSVGAWPASKSLEAADLAEVATTA